MTVQEALARAKAPVTVTFSQRYLLNVMYEALESEISKTEGTLRRVKNDNSRRVTQSRLDSLRKAHAEVGAARKAA